MTRVIRATAVPAALLAAALWPAAPVAGAEPPTPDGPSDASTYLIGACWDPSQPAEERPATVVYGCDHSSVMEDMTWSSWGADGATGTGVDNAVECQPNCAQGRRLSNPIVVHAWNPAPPDKPGCPPGLQFYRDMTVAYPATAPPWVVPGTSWTDGVDYIDVDGMPAVHFQYQGPYSCTPLSG
nr:hypothetical protein [Mycolicibacterium palauense]